MTDLRVVPISSKKQSGKNVVERLEEAIAMAKSGTVDNCVIVMTCSNGDVVDCWANGGNPFVMVGALEAIKREFMDAVIQSRGD